MKKLVLFVCFAAAALLLGACATAPGIKVPTPQQLVTDICPIVNADLGILSKSPLLTSAQQSTLTNTIIPGNAAVCAAGGAINVTDLQAFNATVFPALVGLVAAIPAIPNQPVILLALELAGPLVTQIVNDAVTATATSASAATTGAAAQ